MSWQIDPLKVHWPRFLKSFPKPGKWAKSTRKRLKYDDVRWQTPWVACYSAMTPHLPDETVFAVDWFIRALSIEPLPKPKGFKAPERYKPHRDFDPEDFQGPASGCELIPPLSPGNVVDMMHRLRLRDPARIDKDFRKAWNRLEGKKALEPLKEMEIDDPGPFLESFAEWRKVFEEVEAAGAGYAYDLI